ncbi:GAK system ATP-grasp enzyme [Thalassospira sp. GB04J01]|uniref:GAK system ATP-grasp enzyme n=1 Tax=Thalassospira sp. GB04J01 TaxID=1485225 RepID=UPI000C99B0C0|nr:GAK system ATP-grasp enzyme [Thalassospira sp. GB04J01]
MTYKKIAVVGIPGKWSTEALADALEEKTDFRLVVDMADVTADLATGTLTAKGVDLTNLDGLVVKKITEVYSPNSLDRLELLRLAEAAGVRVFSPAVNMLRLIDRLACTVTLRNGGIPMPETQVTENVDVAVKAVKTFGAAVFKPLYSTKARGMTVIDSTQPDAEILDAITAFKAENPMMYIQRKLSLPGQDLGLVFLGGTYYGAYARVAKNDAWNTTINSGGNYAPFECDPDVVEMARRAQALFNMDFTTVDVALTDQGPIVFEVSAFGGFRGAKEGIGIDAAALYADYILDALS